MREEKTITRLIQLLADGAWHTGESLGKSLGCSRAAVWKALKQLPEYGLEYESASGSGYRLGSPLELIDRSALLESLEDFESFAEERLFLHDCIGSTNSFLMERYSQGVSNLPAVCTAEMQLGGRGRRGRVWQSPYAKNIYLSQSRLFKGGVAALEGLSLAVGVVVCEALSELGFSGLSLKWPNDLLIANKKVGGILVELAGDASGDCVAVVGLGLNVDMASSSFGVGIDQVWTDLNSESCVIPRNTLLAKITSALYDLLEEYENMGFSRFKSRWEALNAYSGQLVRISSESGYAEGMMVGLSSNGGLVLSVDGSEKTFIGGELSLRLAS